MEGSDASEDALDMRVSKAGHDKIPLARIERKARQSIEEDDQGVAQGPCPRHDPSNGNENSLK